MGIVRAGNLKTIGLSNTQVVGGSLRFDSASSQYLSRTPASVGNKRTWTWSSWVKRSKLGSEQVLFLATAGINPHNGIWFQSSDKLSWVAYDSGYPFEATTTQVFRDTSAWYHIVAIFDTTQATEANRLIFYVNGLKITQYDSISYPSQNFDNGLINTNTNTHKIGDWSSSYPRFLSAYLSNTNFIDGQALDPSYFGYTDPLTNTWRPKKFKPQATPNYGATWSNNWTASGDGFGSNPVSNIFDSSASNYMNNNAGGQIVTWNTTSYTLGGRLRIYGYSSSGLYDIYVNGTKAADTGSSLAWIDCGTFSSITEIQFAGTTYNTNNGLGSAGIIVYLIEINGVPLLDSDTLNIGTNGFYLPFDGAGDSIGSNTNVGKDRSGRGNNWSLNGFSPTFSDPDIVPDSPSGISYSTNTTAGIGTTTALSKPSNYSVLNPLTTNSAALSKANLRVVFSTNGTRNESTVAVSSGKWYWEGYAEANMTTSYIGGRFALCVSSSKSDPESVEFNLDWHATSGLTRRVNGSSTVVASGTNYTDGDYIAIALDADNSIAYFYKNNSLTYTYDFSAYVTPKSQLLTAHAWGFFSSTWVYNFGQKPFKYTPPAGYLPLCTANAPRPTIVRPDQYVGVATYTGTGSAQNINIGWKPDFVWIKRRADSSNELYDSVRGVEKQLFSNLTNVESVRSPGQSLVSFNNNGFTVGTLGGVNQISESYVAWYWKAGGGAGITTSFWKDDVNYATASAAGLTAGTITPTGASVNTKSGFSIIAYTGNGSSSQSVPHGLGQTPAMIILKGRAGTNADNNWYIWHKGLSSSKNINLNNTTSERGTDVFTSGIIAAPSNTTTFGFTAGSSLLNVNESGTTYITYLWAEIPGFSKFGTYVCTSNSNGPTIITGFRPKIVILKCYDSTSEWAVYDSERNKSNPMTNTLFWSSSNAENTPDYGDIDFLSNGFKIRASSGAYINNTPDDFIWMAFAESPSFNLYGGQSNAR